MYTLHNFFDDYRTQVLKEIYRVLKPGGVFVNADKYAQDDPKEYEHAYNEQIKNMEIYDKIGKHDYKEQWLKHYKEDERPEVIMYENQSKELMKTIGYKDVKTTFRKIMEAVVIAEK